MPGPWATPFKEGRAAEFPPALFFYGWAEQNQYVLVAERSANLEYKIKARELLKKHYSAFLDIKIGKAH